MKSEFPKQRRQLIADLESILATWDDYPQDNPLTVTLGPTSITVVGTKAAVEALLTKIKRMKGPKVSPPRHIAGIVSHQRVKVAEEN